MFLKTALQRDLDRFFKAIRQEDFNIRQVTKSALTQARRKLNPWAFHRLNEVAVERFYKDAPYITWRGHRTLAIDGTRLTLPNHPSIEAEFPKKQFGPKADSPRSLAIGSILYDVFNHITIDGQLTAYTGSERGLFEEHLPKVEAGDLLLLDRGYPCFWVFFLLQARDIEFCVRLKSGWWKAVRNFVKSGEEQAIVSFSLPAKDRDHLAEYPEVWNTKLPCRLVRVELENGEVEVLCTSLTDQQAYPVEEFKELYHYRWNVEEAYKLLKERIDLEDFSGKTAIAVKQDFAAKIFMLTMVAAMAFPIQEKVRLEYKADKNRKHDQQINWTHAIATFWDSLVPIFIRKKTKSGIAHFDDVVYKTREIVRPGRSYERKKRPKRLRRPNYKPL